MSTSLQQTKQKKSLQHKNAIRGDNATLVEHTSKSLLQRIPPHSIEAEQAVLGGVFLRNAVFHTLIDIIISEDFYHPNHKILYNAFLELYQKNAPIDLISVAEILKDQGKLETVGGAAYLAELAQTVVSGANAEYYATIIRDKALQRSLIITCSDVISNCFETSCNIDNLLDDSEQMIFAVSERTTGKAFKTSKALITNVFQELEKRFERKEQVTGITTGYTRLDQLTAGLQASDLVIVAARPSMGKTAFSLNMAMRASVNQNIPVAIYSLEMSMHQLMMRMLCAWGKINLSHLRHGYLNDDEWNRLYQAADVLAQAPIFIDDTPALSPLELRARTRRIKSESNIGLVVIDYLQLMKGNRRIDSREQEISEISRSLKALAKELNIPIVALSQLNRKLEDRTDKRPLLSDLRESGAIEQDADVIMFIYRDEVYNKQDDNPRKGLAEIIIGKQRNGPIGTATLTYLNSYTAFEDNEPHYPPA